ncbi:NAC domain-containing protein 60 [Prunus yedoensis var. nudiflora]|uniref:NAC domain-containing protein 60 n=1 Tax=Prunus yedoensis var. nudiflora TaxID=2094558 RepID=A0A314ZUU6_PRUYE|nr:NAC domain-containing protein 60 [Prunus yedoensis var. nudiflora]
MGSSSGTTDERVSVPMGLLPGIKFSPTDKELVSFYLKNKIAGEDSEFSNIIPEINLREHEPRDLPEFFFNEPAYMSPNGDSCFRTTNEGFYKSTGKPREIEDELSKAVIGEKRYMPFYEGRAPEHKLTKYVLHQFSLTKTELAKLATNREVSTKARNPKPNYKKRKYDSNCDKLAEHGIPGYIASNYKDDQTAAAANMIPEPEEHLADKDGLLGSENRNECAESESANGSRLINNNDSSTRAVGSPGGCFPSGYGNLAAYDPFQDEVSFQTEGNLISSFHPSSLRDIPLRTHIPQYQPASIHVFTHTGVLREESDCKAVSQDKVRDAAEYCFALHLKTKSWKHTV